MNKYHITKEGLKKAKDELELLKGKRKDIIEKIKSTKEEGDLSENAGYDEAKQDMAFNETHIQELEDLIKNAEIIKVTKSDGFVRLGSNIKVKNASGERTFTLVGPAEADPSEGMISNESPLGKAFMNRQVGESFDVTTPGGTTKYQILEVN